MSRLASLAPHQRSWHGALTFWPEIGACIYKFHLEINLSQCDKNQCRRRAEALAAGALKLLKEMSRARMAASCGTRAWPCGQLVMASSIAVA